MHAVIGGEIQLPVVRDHVGSAERGPDRPGLERAEKDDVSLAIGAQTTELPLTPEAIWKKTQEVPR